MATPTPPVVRRSLPLNERDLAGIERLRGSEQHRAALARYSSAPVTASSSEAAVLHAIMEAGLRAIREQVEEQGYTQIASRQDYDRQAVARRRRPTWADE